MKKVINVLTIIAAWFTCLMIICTFLTSYQFCYIGMVFNTYMPVELSVAITMGLLAIRFLVFEKGRRRIIYFLFSVLFCSIMSYSIFYVK